MIKDMLKIAGGVAAFYVIRGFLPANIKAYLS